MGINERIKSAAAFEQALKVIPGGVNSPVRALKSVGTTPLRKGGQRRILYRH